MRWLIVLALAVALAPACAPSTTDIRVDVDHVMAHIQALTAIGPRPQDSDGSRTAAGFIEDELDRLGIDVKRMPVGTLELPEIRVLGRVYREARRVQTTDPNLLVRFGPPGKALLVMAHYDTVARSPGAADNAASIALLLDLARTLHDEPPAQPIMLAFTANEEIGLVGAEALAAELGDSIALAIALDLVGGDGRLTLNGASTLIGYAEMTWLAAAARRVGIALSVPPAHRVISRWWPQSERSDHGPFTRRAVRAIHFYNRGNDGEWIDLAYHSPGDTLARIDRASVGDAARMLRALVAAPVPAPDGDSFWLPFADNTIVSRWLLVAFELALVALVIVVLVIDRKPREPRAGPALLIGAGCYVLAVVITCVLERVVAELHPAPWLHDPLRALIANALVLAGIFGLATRAVARWKPWHGEHRYLALASITCAVIGALLVALGAAELAWIWLVPATALALAPRLGVFRVIAIALAALPVVLVLHPFQLREAAWNGFLPVSLPLSLWLAMLGTPTIATVAWALRRGRPTGPLGTLVLGLGCGLAVILGLVFAITSEPPCSAANFGTFHLACERV